MKNKIHLVSLACITLLFLGLLISRNTINSDFNASIRNISVDSEEFEIDNSCNSLCKEAYCSNEECKDAYIQCSSECNKATTNLGE